MGRKGLSPRTLRDGEGPLWSRWPPPLPPSHQQKLGRGLWSGSWTLLHPHHLWHGSSGCQGVPQGDPQLCIPGCLVAPGVQGRSRAKPSLSWGALVGTLPGSHSLGPRGVWP